MDQPEQKSAYSWSDGVQDLCGFGGAALVGYGGELLLTGVGFVAGGIMLYLLAVRN